MSHAGDLAWVNDYVGVPYVENGRDRDGWDCWGLVLAVYRDRLGVELPDWRWKEPFGPVERLRAFKEAVGDGVGQATELVAPEDYAIVLSHAFSDRPHHVGVCVGFGVLHAARYGGTIYEPIGRFVRVNSRCKWFRWRA